MGMELDEQTYAPDVLMAGSDGSLVLKSGASGLLYEEAIRVQFVPPMRDHALTAPVFDIFQGVAPFPIVGRSE